MSKSCNSFRTTQHILFHFFPMLGNLQSSNLSLICSIGNGLQSILYKMLFQLYQFAEAELKNSAALSKIRPIGKSHDAKDRVNTATGKMNGWKLKENFKPLISCRD